MSPFTKPFIKETIPIPSEMKGELEVREEDFTEALKFISKQSGTSHNG